ERWFRSPSVLVARPMIHGAVGALGVVRRFHWEAQGLDHLADLDTPIILAANHQSHADTAAILGTLPRRIRRRTAVAAALDVFGREGGGSAPSLKRIYLEWVVAAGFHAFAFDRHGPPLRSLRTSVTLIRNGWSLLLYPEGTRSRNGEIRKFKAGVGVLARFSRRPVVPVHVDGGRFVLPCGAFMPRPGEMTVRYGAPMWHDEAESPEAFTSRVQAEVCRLG